MNVFIYSRDEIERIIKNGEFPRNTVVISFYDPAVRQLDPEYAPVDLSKGCKSVFYCELDDIDSPEENGYTYDSFFPEADDMAEFIINAYLCGRDIICQCEYGQSRSAGCAAAIMEFFFHSGIDIFTDNKRYPSQLVYHKVYDALERQKLYVTNEYYYAARTSTIHNHISRLGLPETVMSGYKPENSDSVIDVKYAMERVLSMRGMLYHSQEKIIEAMLTTGQPVYASFHVTNPHNLYEYYFLLTYGVYTVFKYGCEKVPVNIMFSAYRTSAKKDCVWFDTPSDVYFLPTSRLSSLDFFGTLYLDKNRRVITAAPLIITNIRF